MDIPNAVTRSLREGIIEYDKLDIPYDSEGFVKWLTESAHLSLKRAKQQVQYIRDADIELWEPGAEEVFVEISQNIAEAINAKSESIRSLNYDYVFISLTEEVNYLIELKEEVEEESIPFINSVIDAYKYYIVYMMESLNYSQKDLASLLKITNTDINQLKSDNNIENTVDLDDIIENTEEYIEFEKHFQNLMESSLSENIDLEDDDFDLEDDLEDFEDEYIDSEEEPEDLDKWIAEAKKYSNVTIQKKYPPVPFEDEFKEYLINSYFPNRTRYKMLTNLRKLNSLIINNGRGDSDWLQKLADRASKGLNIRYSRLVADKMIHSVMENIDNYDEISISDLRGGLTAIGKYIDFLILKSKNIERYDI